MHRPSLLACATTDTASARCIVMIRCRATPSLSMTARCVTRQRKQELLRRCRQMYAKHADGPESGTVLHSRHLTTTPEGSRCYGHPVRPACFACIRLHLRKDSCLLGSPRAALCRAAAPIARRLPERHAPNREAAGQIGDAGCRAPERDDAAGAWEATPHAQRTDSLDPSVHKVHRGRPRRRQNPMHQYFALAGQADGHEYAGHAAGPDAPIHGLTWRRAVSPSRIRDVHETEQRWPTQDHMQQGSEGRAIGCGRLVSAATARLHAPAPGATPAHIGARPGAIGAAWPASRPMARAPTQQEAHAPEPPTPQACRRVSASGHGTAKPHAPERRPARPLLSRWRVLLRRQRRQNPLHQFRRPSPEVVRTRRRHVSLRNRRQNPMHQSAPGTARSAPRCWSGWLRGQEPMHQFTPRGRTPATGPYRPAAQHAAGCGNRR